MRLFKKNNKPQQQQELCNHVYEKICVYFNTDKNLRIILYKCSFCDTPKYIKSKLCNHKFDFLYNIKDYENKLNIDFFQCKKCNEVYYKEKEWINTENLYHEID